MEADTPKSGQNVFGSESINVGNKSATLKTPTKANKSVFFNTGPFLRDGQWKVTNQEDLKNAFFSHVSPLKANENKENKNDSAGKSKQAKKFVLKPVFKNPL